MHREWPESDSPRSSALFFFLLIQVGFEDVADSRSAEKDVLRSVFRGMNGSGVVVPTGLSPAFRRYASIVILVFCIMVAPFALILRTREIQFLYQLRKDQIALKNDEMGDGLFNRRPVTRQFSPCHRQKYDIDAYRSGFIRHFSTDLPFSFPGPVRQTSTNLFSALDKAP